MSTFSPFDWDLSPLQLPTTSIAATDDRYWMQIALTLAQQCDNRARPNPRVGAVLVRDLGAGQTQCIGVGATQPVGGDHAEIVALKAAQQQGHQIAGNTLYVTLEPCAHQGRTGPCVQAIVAAGIDRVVIATLDPYPAVNGQGVAYLQAHGVKVEVGLMTAEAQRINAGFFSRVTRARPHIRAKVAHSVDGITALTNGNSQWITGPAARRDGHRLRAHSCAIVTGIGTVLADDPQLTVRDVPCFNAPIRVLLDSQARVPLTAKILQGPPIVHLATQRNDTVKRLAAAGHHCLTVAANSAGQIDLAACWSALAAFEWNELWVEAGGSLIGNLLAADLIDELWCYQAPLLLGQGRGIIDWQLSQLTHGQQLQRLDQRLIGDDLRLIFQPQKNS